MNSSGTVPADTPRNTSAPSSASAAPPVSAARVGARGQVGLDLVEIVAAGGDDALRVEHDDIGDPAASRMFAQATPAAPAPEMTTRRPRMSRPGPWPRP